MSLSHEPSAMKRFSVVGVAFLAGAIGHTAPVETVAAPLSDLFKPGIALQDRNGDGAIDFVNARIVLPDKPDAPEIAAASNIAARLGFETSAMDIPVNTLRPKADARGESPETPLIFVGAKSLAPLELTPASLGFGLPKPGEGVGTTFTAGA